MPSAITTDAASNVYVVDGTTVRKVTQAGVVTTIVGNPYQTGFLPGPLPGVIGPPSGIVISGTSLYITTNQGVAVVTNVP